MSSIKSKRAGRGGGSQGRRGEKAKAPYVRAVLARNLRWARKKRRWSQSRLGSESGVSQKHVSNAERGATTSSVEVVSRLGEALALSPELLTWPGLTYADAARVRLLDELLRDTRGRQKLVSGSPNDPFALQTSDRTTGDRT
jgi:transcriptional regulator with XRE-family HTH domain